MLRLISAVTPHGAALACQAAAASYRHALTALAPAPPVPKRREEFPVATAAECEAAATGHPECNALETLPPIVWESPEEHAARCARAHDLALRRKDRVAQFRI